MVLCPFPIIWTFHDHSLQSRFYHADCAFPRRQIRAIRYVQELIEYWNPHFTKYEAPKCLKHKPYHDHVGNMCVVFAEKTLPLKSCLWYYTPVWIINYFQIFVCGKNIYRSNESKEVSLVVPWLFCLQIKQFSLFLLNTSSVTK